MDRWEINRRYQEIERFQELIKRAEQNPADPAPLRDLVIYADRRDDWDRTQLLAQARSLGRRFQQTPEARQPFDEILLPAIRKGLRDGSPYVRREAALAAGAFGPLAAGAVPELVQVMSSHPGEDASWFSAEALGNMGRLSQNAIPALEKAAIEGSDSLQEEARRAIKKIQNAMADSR